MKLTGKQEKFSQAVASGMSLSDAYRDAYDCSKMTDKSVWEKSSELASNVKVSSRVKEIQAEINAKTVEKTAITREDLIVELEEARTAAMAGGKSGPQSAAAVAATMGKAKLLGLQVDKVEHSGLLATMDVAAGLTDAQKTQASIAILRQSIGSPSVEAFAKDVLREHGYEFED